MKKFIALVLSLCIVGGSAPAAVGYLGDNSITASAAEYTEGEIGSIQYLQYADHIEIIGFDNSVAGPVELLSEINGLPITVIRSGAFQTCKYITSMKLPSTVTTIGSAAFDYCLALESVVMSDSVTSVGEAAFSRCDKLKSVTFSSNLSEIPQSCFEDCVSLESIVIPENITSIGLSAFYGCYALTSVTIKNPNCAIYDSNTTFSDTAREYSDYAAFHGTIYGYEGSTAQAYAEKYNINFVALEGGDIPIEASSGTCGENLTWVLDSYGTLTISGTGDMFDYSPSKYSPFYDNEDIKSVIIKNGVTSIGADAFRECTSLTSITIPDSVTHIDGGAFNYCSSLTSITIPDSVTSIGSATFDYCTSLESVTIGNSVTSIDNYAFEGCSSLTSITIPDSVTSIGSGAFAYCTSLESITIPDSVTSIGYEAFRSCSSLTSVTIPDSVTSMGDMAFNSCTSLTSITIPNSVTSIGWSAFSYCESLTSITILNPDCEIYDSHSTIFNGCDSEKGGDYFDGTIYGYEGSTAQAYAEKYGYTFVALNGEPPVTTTTTTTTTTTVPPVTTTTSNETPPVTTTNSATPGDINGDGDVTVADATYIMQWAAAPDEYPLSDTAKKNGDVTGGGDGITTSDALVIQQYLSGAISALPVQQ